MGTGWKRREPIEDVAVRSLLTSKCFGVAVATDFPKQYSKALVRERLSVGFEASRCHHVVVFCVLLLVRNKSVQDILSLLPEVGLHILLNLVTTTIEPADI